MLIQKVLLVADEELLRSDLEKQLLPRYELVPAATMAEGQEKLSGGDFDLIITETALPDGTALELLQQLTARGALPLVIVISAFGSMESAVECLNHGAFACVLKPFSGQQVQAVLRKAEEHARLVKVAEHLSREGLSEQVGRSPAIEQLHALVRKVARTEATVLIRGESGVGKELVARCLFAQSPRAAAPFIKFDCAVIPEARPELFGLAGRAGLFELAQRGTILLDEIALLAASAQATLLQVLRKQELEREKGKPPLAIDVRIIATTNRQLEEKVKRNEFREDLFLALNIVPVTVPPLRERAEDIPLLAEHFRQSFGRRHGVETVAFPPATLDALRQY